MSLLRLRVTQLNSLQQSSYHLVHLKVALSHLAQIHRAALFCTFSSAVISFFKWGDQTCMANSRWGRTRAKYALFFAVFEQPAKFLLIRLRILVALKVERLIWSPHFSLQSITTPRYLKVSTHSSLMAFRK